MHDGQVTGPYSTRQLKQMAAAGMIVAADMISADQVNWQVAGQVRGLFRTEQVTAKHSPTRVEVSPVDGSPGSGDVERATGIGRRIAVLALLLFVMIAGGMLLNAIRKDKPTVEDETPGQKHEETRHSFTGGPRELGGEHATDIRAFFDELKRGVVEGDKQKVANLFDLRMTIDLLKQQKMLSAEIAGHEDEAAAFLGRDVAKAITASATGWHWWDRHEVRHVRFVRPGIEAVVYVRMWGDGGSAKMRWWLYRKGDKWLAYDFEDLSLPMRMSALQAFGWKEAVGNDPSFASMLRFGPAIQEVLTGDTERGLATLRSLEKAKFPPTFEAMRLSFISLALLDLGQYADAIRAADQAEALTNDMPMIPEIRGHCHNALGQHSKALADAERLAECLGKDATYFTIVGDAYRGLGRAVDAIRAFESALADDPSDIDAFMGLVRVLPAGQRQSLFDRYRGLGKVGEKFPAMAGQLLAERDADALRALIDLHRAIRPGDGNVAVFERKLAELKSSD